MKRLRGTSDKTSAASGGKAGGVSRIDFNTRLKMLLNPTDFKDYCPNGLQVEGRGQIRRLITGVTANLALIESAVAAHADAILVHHGLFWRGDDMRITGWRRERIATLLAHDINLFAYHLPLDAHVDLGNNAALGRVLGLKADAQLGEQGIIFTGTLRKASTAADFATHAARALGRTPLLVGDGARAVRRIAWCTGGAQGYFEAALAAGCDLYLSGEISEQTTHLARETGIPYLACGHHATERYGVQAVGAWCARQFGIEHRFIDIDNPV